MNLFSDCAAASGNLPKLTNSSPPGFRLLRLVAWFLIPVASCTAAPHDLDQPFGSGVGASSVSFAGLSSKVDALAVQSDGKIILAGTLQSTATSRGLVLARLLANGTLDTSFGSGGVTGFIPTETNAVECAAVIVQPDGKILVGGSRFTSSTGWDYQLVRYLASGQIDTGFGSSGFVLVNSTSSAGCKRACSVQVAPLPVKT